MMSMMMKETNLMTQTPIYHSLVATGPDGPVNHEVVEQIRTRPKKSFADIERELFGGPQNLNPQIPTQRRGKKSR